MDLDAKQKTAVTLFAQGTPKEKIAKEVGEPVQLIDFWCQSFEQIQQDLMKTKNDVSKILKDWRLADIDENILKESIKKITLLTAVKIATVIPQKDVMLDYQSSQALHIHSKTIKELAELLKAFEANTQNLADLLKTPPQERVNQQAIEKASTNEYPKVI